MQSHPFPCFGGDSFPVDVRRSRPFSIAPDFPRPEETPLPARPETISAFQRLGGTRLDDRRFVLHPAMGGPFFSLPHTTTDDALKKLPAVPFSFGLDVRISGITDQGLSLLADTLEPIASRSCYCQGDHRCRTQASPSKNLRSLNVSFNVNLAIRRKLGTGAGEEVEAFPLRMRRHGPRAHGAEKLPAPNSGDRQFNKNC